ncbi:spore maturation protein [Clostridium cylindrosporum]|uniref:Spore maturation protein B n=1 Tax=Clostridium cylindrosporum DSM 605 TaxID=1121307 RepID=A0A0J8DFI2_CLOCY|nr:nucleoside recognition domain-containing protein [Clostridium cylindrosporum]KMT22938.1 spore maturation protein B [Clostridium cylindrosporum DSM 605]
MSQYIVPIMILCILFFAVFKRVKVFEEFVDGAKDGFKSVVKIAPFLLTMLFAIDIFRQSGALEWLLSFFAPLAKLIGIPEGVVPMIIIKPLSGSASLGVMTDIMNTYGVDSIEGKIASVLMGSTETIFYTLSIYFGALGIKKIRHSLSAALIAHILGSVATVYICYAFFA